MNNPTSTYQNQEHTVTTTPTAPTISPVRQAVDDMRDGLLALGEWLDRHPEIATHQSRSTWIVSTWKTPDLSPDVIVRAMKDGAPLGAVTKSVATDQDSTLFVERSFGGQVTLQYQASRSEVCERVVVGTETVHVSDPEARMVEVERDVIEWRCSPILTGLST